MTENVPNVTSEKDPGYGQLLAVLLRRRFWLLSIFCSVLSIATIITITTDPTYQSSIQLLVESNYKEKERQGEPGLDSQFADPNVEIDYTTQLNLMRSSLLVQKAVDLLRSEYPTLSVEDIKQSLVVTQVVEDEVSTKIFQAVYTDNDPVKTQKVLKAIQWVYQDYNLKQQKLRLTKGLAFIDEQLPAARESLLKTEVALEQFRKSQSLIDPEQRASDIAETLKAVEQERQATHAQYEQSQRRYVALRQQVDRSPQEALISSRLSESTRYQGLLDEIQKTELELAQERLRFTDSHPYLQKVLSQRESQVALLQKEVGRVVGQQLTRPKDTGESLLEEGQLGDTDLNLTSELVEAQTNSLSLKAREQSLAQTEQQLKKALNQLPALLAEYSRLQPQVELKRDALQQLLKARQELSQEIARGGFDWQVVEEPQLGAQIAPNPKQYLLLGAVVGLILGGIAAFVRETIDDSIYTADELKQQVALPLLGTMPELPQANISKPILNLPFLKQRTMTFQTDQMVHGSSFREALDLIYQNIQLLSSDSLPKSLVITSALASEGKSTLALALAISAARLHKRVLLIDADLRRPSLHEQLNLPNEQGLSTLLGSEANVSGQNSIQPSSSCIDVLTSGPTPLDPANLLSSQRMKELIGTFEQTYDLVILDSPPVLGLVDTVLAAPFCSGIVMVGRLGRVSQTELMKAIDVLNSLNIIGIVANGASNSTGSYISYMKQDGSPSLHLYQPLIPDQEPVITK